MYVYVYTYTYTCFFKLPKKEKNRVLLHRILYLDVFFFFFLLNNISWHSFLIHLLPLINAWFSNTWTCHNLLNRYPINGKIDILKTSVGPLTVDTLTIHS